MMHGGTRHAPRGPPIRFAPLHTILLQLPGPPRQPGPGARPEPLAPRLRRTVHRPCSRLLRMRRGRRRPASHRAGRTQQPTPWPHCNSKRSSCPRRMPAAGTQPTLHAGTSWRQRLREARLRHRRQQASPCPRSGRRRRAPALPAGQAAMASPASGAARRRRRAHALMRQQQQQQLTAALRQSQAPPPACLPRWAPQSPPSWRQPRAWPPAWWPSPVPPRLRCHHHHHHQLPQPTPAPSALRPGGPPRPPPGAASTPAPRPWPPSA